MAGYPWGQQRALPQGQPKCRSRPGLPTRSRSTPGSARPATLTRGSPVDLHGHAARARVHSNDSLRARWARAAGDVTCLLHLIEFASQLHSRPDVGTRFARTRVVCATTLSQSRHRDRRCDE
jgi:hypothetical protein